MNYQEFVPNLIGLIGVCFILSAYALLQIAYWKSDELLFSVFNFLGACFILFSLLFNWNLASATIEVTWLLISAYRIILTLRQRFLLKKNEQKDPFSKINLRENASKYFVPLKPKEIDSFLQDIGNDWEVTKEGHLKKSWIFSTYQESIDFVNKVVEKAEKNNHHPVFLIEYKKITITIWTHNVNAITQADYILASKISRIAT